MSDNPYENIEELLAEAQETKQLIAEHASELCLVASTIQTAAGPLPVFTLTALLPDENNEENVVMAPVAILMTNDLFAMLQAPEGSEPVKKLMGDEQTTERGGDIPKKKVPLIGQAPEVQPDADGKVSTGTRAAEGTSSSEIHDGGIEKAR